MLPVKDLTIQKLIHKCLNALVLRTQGMVVHSQRDLALQVLTVLRSSRTASTAFLLAVQIPRELGDFGAVAQPHVHLASRNEWDEENPRLQELKCQISANPAVAALQ
eukprot:TRINITY_DN66_c0_g2_i1.p1 TRINITY_DN66_c0_g2~~TRINITY_DN66_c0_g2_i1.p1  ORF type:complete len:107 (+),score=15.83 TRINITY_DN66_c0_g2_i1:208-528(+)